MRIVFMGTPDFSVGTLKALLAAGHEVTLVVTQPDRVRGRGKKPSFSPVKECAVSYGIPCYQPERIRQPECYDRLKAEGADVYVVVAFGQLLPQAILDLPRLGCVNVHASLLPKYRGAAPIQWAILNGDPVSGVTTMQMDAGMDTGDILLREEVILAEDETGGSLFERLAQTGADLCVETLRRLEAGTIRPVPQAEEEASHTRMINKEDGRIDFSRSALEIDRQIRAMDPWPSAFTSLDGKSLKIWQAKPCRGEGEAGKAPGTVFRVDQDAFYVAAGDGALRVSALQLAGKKRMPTGDFLRGYTLAEGTLLV